MGAYRAAYERSIDDPSGFWRDAAADIDWHRPPDGILDDGRAPLYRWFPDGELNTCHNAARPARRRPAAATSRR